ncbi:hypothetical protein ACFOYZ_29585 [Neobacillus cucumis]|uniref:hypothetical protein n=1 Tax=Neobacillus cucumis TaxID=1740721 RepID=UPI003615D323
MPFWNAAFSHAFSAASSRHFSAACEAFSALTPGGRTSVQAGTASDRTPAAFV